MKTSLKHRASLAECMTTFKSENGDQRREGTMRSHGTKKVLQEE